MALEHARISCLGLCLLCLEACGNGSSVPTVGSACAKSGAGFCTADKKCDPTATTSDCNALWKSFCCENAGTCNQPLPAVDPGVYQQCSDDLALWSCSDIVNADLPSSCIFTSGSATSTDTSTSTGTSTKVNAPPCTPPTTNSCSQNGCFSTNVFTSTNGGVCSRSYNYTVYGATSTNQIWLDVNSDGSVSGRYETLGCQTSAGGICIPYATSSYSAATVTVSDGFVQSQESYLGTFCGYFVDSTGKGISITGSVNMTVDMTSTCS